MSKPDAEDDPMTMEDRDMTPQETKALAEDACRSCGRDSSGGDGWDGMCGNCADRDLSVAAAALGRKGGAAGRGAKKARSSEPEWAEGEWENIEVDEQ